MEEMARNCQDEDEARNDRLRQLLNTLNETRNEVLKNTEAAQLEINGTFATLTKTLLENVEKRKLELLKKVDAIKDDTLTPLDECCANVESQLQQPRNVAKTGAAGRRKVCNVNGSSSDDNSVYCFPEMPKPCDIPTVTVRFNVSAVEQCLASVLRLGRVSYVDPIEIVEIREKPGALAVLWEEPETDFLLDLENVQYRLQYCRRGNVDVKGPTDETKYADAYVGPDTSCVVRNLMLDCEYCFRVCRTADEEEWSGVHVAKTTVLPYEWDPSAGVDYSLSDERRIAAKVTSNPSPLHSGGPQFRGGHSLQFVFLQCGTGGQPDDGLGLALEKISGDGSPVGPGTIFVNCEGSIFVDGVRTSTRLPGLFPGCTIAFESEEDSRNDKMRVMITCEGKRVTYDWRLDGVSDQRQVYFFVRFSEEGWRVRVE